MVGVGSAVGEDVAVERAVVAAVGVGMVLVSAGCIPARVRVGPGKGCVRGGWLVGVGLADRQAESTSENNTR